LKPLYQRLIAIAILCIPGIGAVYGWTVMRDIFFDYWAGQGFAWLKFLWGLFIFVFCLGILGGFIFYRDKKQGKIQPKLLKKEEREQLKKEKPKHKFLDKV
jgi:hypothetical protein